jgi:hypothetical protein
MPVLDLTGRTFDRLRVLERVEPRDRADDHAMWACECDCGARVTVRGAKLRSGAIRSCGCLRADPGIRRAARLQVPERRRRAIARAGGAAFAAAAEKRRKS